MVSEVETVLRKYANEPNFFAPVLSSLPYANNNNDDGSGHCNVTIFDFTAENVELNKPGVLGNVDRMTEYVFSVMRERGSKIGVGRYDENRTIYKSSSLFSGGEEESRSLHLGIDLFVEAGTPIYAPLDGRVHSFRNNANNGDYGPTIILAHELDGVVFYTLYGHLTLDSIENELTKKPCIKVGQRFKRGEELCRVGPYPVNGNWPPHLHFQVIAPQHQPTKINNNNNNTTNSVVVVDDDFADAAYLLNPIDGVWWGDYPGVAKPSERAKYLRLCPDPNLILGLPFPTQPPADQEPIITVTTTTTATATATATTT